MLNVFYYIPMQFVGFRVWSKNMNEESHEVVKKTMSPSALTFMIASVAAGTVAYGFLLKHLGDAMPFVDAFTTVASVAAMIVSVRMYAEQWWIWIVINVFSVYMWWCDFVAGSDNIATLLMWSVYLANSVIMLIKWKKESDSHDEV